MPAHRPRILVIDDEPQIHRFLGPALEANGYEAIRAMTAAEGLAVLFQRPPEAMILDLGLPDRDGQDVLVEARTMYQGPILILSARDRETEKIEALDRGADDYVEKPFGIGELLARLRAALRHTIARSGVSSVIRTGELEIDLVNRRVSRDETAVRWSSWSRAAARW
jgi:two-component system KDP operon response regulator KdpE